MRQIGRLAEHRGRDVAWAGNDNVIVTVSVTGRAIGVSGPRQEFFLAQSFNIATHQQKGLLENSSESMNIVLGDPAVRTIDGDTVVFMDGITFPNHVVGVPGLFMVPRTTFSPSSATTLEMTPSMGETMVV